MKNILNQITKYSVYLLVFLMPLFFLPFSFEAFEFNKQYLLFFLVSLAFMAWLSKMILIDKEVRIKWSPLDIFVLVFLAVAILSAVFSVNQTSSLFGFYGRFSDGLIGLLSLGLFYFLIINNAGLKAKNQNSKVKSASENLKVEKEKGGQLVFVNGLIKVLLGSVSFVVLLSYFSIFGVWQKINEFISLPLVMQREIFNPASGSLESLAVFLAVALVLVIGIIITDRREQEQIKEKSTKAAKLGIYILLLAIFGLLTIINFSPAWLIILLTLLFFLFIVLWKRAYREDINKLLLPILTIIVSIVFLFIPASKVQEQVLNYYLPHEQILGQQESWLIGAEAATENIKSGFLGSGIGTFHYDFSKFKSIEMNQPNLWQIRFDRSGSYFAETLGTMGFLGLISYLTLLGMFLLISYMLLKQNRQGIALFGVFLALLFGQIFFYQNTVLAFSFWLFLALSVVSWQKPLKEKVISFKVFPEISLIFSVLLALLILFFAGIYFFGGRFYLADINYKNYLETENKDNLEKAVELNPYQSQYKMTLARNYLNRIIVEGQKPEEQINQEILSNNIYLAINFAREAIDRSPNRVSAWETLGVVYREIQGVAAGATEWGIKSFEKAIELEPANPALYTELGKLYFFAGNNDKAKEQFVKAKELILGYADATIQLALLYEVEENIEEAIRQMQDSASFYPYNIEVVFQLGRFYLNNNQLDEAIKQLEWAIQLSPNHSNSLYSLAVAYERENEKIKALEVFERVLELNPENENIVHKIQELNVLISQEKEAKEDTEEEREEIRERKETERLEEE